MRNLTFDNWQLGHLVWVVLSVAAVGVYGVWQRRRGLRLFASIRLLDRLAPSVSWTRGLCRMALITLALVLLVAAIMGPRWGERTQRVVRRNIEVIVLLDVSRSMLARDIAPNRLERAKVSIRDDLLPALGGDRIGLITFAGVPTLKCPLTNDYGFFRLALDEISTRSSPRGGTLIGDAIRKAGEAFGDAQGTHKVVILITDGEDHESFPIKAASGLWEDHNIPIVAVALGDERDGARIPSKPGDSEPYVKHEGQVVWSKANFRDLREIAAVSNLNAFIPVGTRNFDLGDIYRRTIVPAIKYKELVERESVPLPSQAHVFAVAALALLLVESLIRGAPRRAEGVISIAPKHRKGAAA